MVVKKNAFIRMLDRAKKINTKDAKELDARLKAQGIRPQKMSKSAIASERKRILGFYGKEEPKTPLEKAQDAYKQFIYVNVNGAKFTVAPNRAVNAIKAYGKTHQGVRYQYANWLKLNDKYQLLLGNSYSKDDVCKGAGMKIWDVAVPQPWIDKPENLKKWKSGEWAVWSYDGANRTFGGPVWRTEVFRNVKKNVLAAMR